jgi:hypothetical protein
MAKMKNAPPAATAAKPAKPPRTTPKEAAPPPGPAPRRTRDGADVGGGSQPWMDPGRPPRP